MRRNELDYVLNTILDFHKDVSDINFTVDRPLQAECSGQLLPVPLNPPIERLTPFQTELLALNLIGGSTRLTEDLLRTGSCDSSYSLNDRARFRVNIFSQRGCYSIVLRKLNAKLREEPRLLGDEHGQEIGEPWPYALRGVVLHAFQDVEDASSDTSTASRSYSAASRLAFAASTR